MTCRWDGACVRTYRSLIIIINGKAHASPSALVLQAGLSFYLPGERIGEPLVIMLLGDVCVTTRCCIGIGTSTTHHQDQKRGRIAWQRVLQA